MKLEQPTEFTGTLTQAFAMADGMVTVHVKVTPDDIRVLRVTSEDARELLSEHILGDRIRVKTWCDVTAADSDQPTLERRDEP